MRKKYVWGNSGSKLNSSLTYLECLWWLQNKKYKEMQHQITKASALVCLVLVYLTLDTESLCMTTASESIDCVKNYVSSYKMNKD